MEESPVKREPLVIAQFLIDEEKNVTVQHNMRQELFVEIVKQYIDNYERVHGVTRPVSN